ncbi:IMPACT family protein [Halomonas sp. MCCC 1A17488]|uniref:IMPACT family protein n=1 Tax=Billgrantia sulfidoxydans TaxID=2733484 RepID=A0ABX7W0J8_9GAMM|nr:MULTISPECIES: YigZ family protein [Halomonas]MCE8016672.1 IMPACT family protein [Halomonas sp. MCCC 1A17488]MCG3240005.1 IMPACT family protein [Halomonas sp. MCCC 1A17488]QPP50108.1 YigZ family protein [Halomonas sp. SS10-MC5]QTP53720.1 IMPACT family protein [Halomonas sulfidoxydans]
MRYPVPDLPPGAWRESVTEVEKSRFIAWLCHAPDVAAFETLLAEARRTHPNASHHCSAYIAGPPGEQNAIGFSDDGEPGGTAGRPMFQVLEGAGLGQVGCVVTRYFGGTKLGTGGLARAYAQAVARGLDALPRREVVERTALRLKVGFAGEAEARAWLESHGVPVEAADYASDGVLLSVGWPSDTEVDLSPLEARLRGNLSLVEAD